MVEVGEGGESEEGENLLIRNSEFQTLVFWLVGELAEPLPLELLNSIEVNGVAGRV